MNFRQLIYIVLLALPLLSCQELPPTIGMERGDRVVASVGSYKLMSSEVASALPANIEGEDSVDFVKLYADRWIKRQIKTMEAERIFSSSAQEIEALVNSYRNSLLTHKLDQYYINTSKEEPFDEAELERYYREHNDRFRLDKSIVKGRLLRIPQGYEGEKRLLDLMQSTSDDSRLDLISISEKYNDLELQEYTSTWIDYAEFISMLPIVRGTSSEYITKSGIQSLEDDSYTYLFEITEYRREGDIAPFERVEPMIRKTLTSKHQAELIRQREEQLYKSAVEADMVRRYIVSIPTEKESESEAHYPALSRLKE